MWRCMECNMDYELAAPPALFTPFVCPNCQRNKLLLKQNESIEKQNQLIESQLERSNYSSMSDSDIEAYAQKVANEKVAGVLSMLNAQLAQENERKKEEDYKFNAILEHVRSLPRDQQLEIFLQLINEDRGEQ